MNGILIAISNPSGSKSYPVYNDDSMLTTPTWINSMIKTESLPTAFAAMAMDFYLPLSDKVASWTKFSKGPIVVGINGAQGTGKSTLSKVLALALKHHHHCRSAILSIDDLYLTKSERRQLAEMVHPLLATRGVPGTHDVAMGCHLLDQQIHIRLVHGFCGTQQIVIGKLRIIRCQ